MKFMNNIRISFYNIKKDIFALKQSVTDWIIFLKTNQTALAQKVAYLEARVVELEKIKQFR